MHATYSYEELKFLVGKVFLSARRSFCQTKVHGLLEFSCSSTSFNDTEQSAIGRVRIWSSAFQALR